jgi:hypothetical protein
MRVYLEGKIIPIDCVSWELFCDPCTLVTDEDPEAHFPVEVTEEATKAVERVIELLKPEKTWLNLTVEAIARFCKI